MSTEQGDVAVIREALKVAERNSVTMMDGERSIAGRAALDSLRARISYQSDLSKRQGLRIQDAETRLEAIERERDDWMLARNEQKARAEKTERALGEQHKFADVAQEYIASLERALGEMREALQGIVAEASEEGFSNYADAVDAARAALRPEDTSDES